MSYVNNPTVTASRIAAYFAQILITAAMLSLTACGGGGGDGNATGTSVASEPTPGTSPSSAAFNYLAVTYDEYGLLTPNFYYSTDNSAFWSIQADVAKDVVDQDFACVIRIDIPKSGPETMAAIIGKTFSIEEAAGHERFPGTFSVFNGHKSVNKRVEHGTISFAGTATTADIKGEFDVILTDYDSTIVPSPQYRLKGKFGFSMGTYGAANPLPSEVYPSQGKEAYDRFCSGCHMLGDYDVTRENASDLSQRGGELPMVYPGDIPDHRGIVLDQQTIWNLRIFLNAW